MLWAVVPSRHRPIPSRPGPVLYCVPLSPWLPSTLSHWMLWEVVCCGGGWGGVSVADSLTITACIQSRQIAVPDPAGRFLLCIRSDAFCHRYILWFDPSAAHPFTPPPRDSPVGPSWLVVARLVLNPLWVSFSTSILDICSRIATVGCGLSSSNPLRGWIY